MPRKPREVSALGIYHVMLRGINKQNIFFDEDDYVRMMTILKNAPFELSQNNVVVADDLCTIYAFCILDNHVHILVKEGRLCLSEIVKKIEAAYALYYNKKHERVGHLFQGRFASEAVNDKDYFYVLLRYIHRNPVKAFEAKRCEDYPYSSWNEYVGSVRNVVKVLKPSAIASVLKRFPLKDLEAWVNEDVNDKCLDMDSSFKATSDKEAMEILSDLCGIADPEDFRQLDPQTQIYYLIEAIDHGISVAQASRLGTQSMYIIKRAYDKKKHPAGSEKPMPMAPNGGKCFKSGSDTDLSQMVGNVEVNEAAHAKVRAIVGLGKNTYHTLHLIVDYLGANHEAKCSEVAESVDLNQEKVRRLLVRLCNENVVCCSGGTKKRRYSLLEE